MKSMSVFAGSMMTAFLFVVLLPQQPCPPAIDPMRETDKVAWQIFLNINRPVSDTHVFWETWAPAGIVFKFPNKEPSFLAKPSGTFELSQSIRDALSSAPPNMKSALSLAEPKPCDPNVPSGGHQVMLNEATVNFIAKEGLYSVEGQIRASKKETIDFPPESIEVKAEWETINPSEVDKFYSHQCGTNVYGLVALHITSKQTPNWLWATFEHTKTSREHNPRQCQSIDCVDTFGATPATGVEHKPTAQLIELFQHSGLSQKSQALWLNYRLVGSQVNFVKSNGSPTLLGNSILEQGVIATSSCITCHSRSTISDEKIRLALGPFSDKSFNGSPDPCWFDADEKHNLKFRQLDFVWSLLLARREDDPEHGAEPKSKNHCGQETLVSQH